MLAICICLVAGDPDLFLGHVFFNMYTYIYIYIYIDLSAVLMAFVSILGTIRGAAQEIHISLHRQEGQGPRAAEGQDEGPRASDSALRYEYGF